MHKEIGLALVPKRGCKKSWPVTPVIPKLNPDSLTAEQQERVSRMIRGSGVSWHTDETRHLMYMLREFVKGMWR